MLLCRESIEREINEACITIIPFSGIRLRAASYVLSLGSRFRRWRSSDRPILVWSEDASFDHLEESIDAEEFTLMPGEFALASTIEKISISNNRFGIISPLSHVARFGLGVNGGADFINPGFGINQPSYLTLELYNYNSSPLILTSGMLVAHLRIGMLDTSSSTSEHLKSIYEGADPLTAPRYFEEWQKKLNDPNE